MNPVAGEPGAGPDADPTPEPGGAPKAPARGAPTPETEAADLEAEPGLSFMQQLFC